MQLTDFQQEELDALGDDPVKASLMMHRNALEKTSDRALNQLDSQLETMTPSETIKLHDSTRKHLNIIDGRHQENQQNNFFILPGELAQGITNRLDEELKEQLNEKEVIDIKPIKEEECQSNQ